MLPYVIIHNAVSLDGKVVGFIPNIALYYEIASRFKEDAALIGSETIIKALQSEKVLNKDIEDYEPEESSSGTEVLGGIEYSISHKTRLLAEGGYDLTFEGMRLGGAVLFGWEKFRLKLGVSYFEPKNTPGGFTLPIIGLWWRFNG